ncbi:hypothetical protein HDV00_007784 [Rhizophlyctis rosea]|nr:hypothetical protein HDV00_007784 [Rhizophlyctis rosea]
MASSLLHEAAAAGDVALTICILNELPENSSVDLPDYSTSRTPLSHAAGSGSIGVASLLIEKGANVNLIDTAGKSPLHWAADNGHADICMLLLDHGANVDSATPNGSTPLHVATLKGHLPIVKILISNGASVTALGPAGTPLHLAARCDHLPIAEYLLDAGAPIEALGVIKETPLHQCAFANSIRVASLLLTNGASVNRAVEPAKMSPLFLASQKGHTDMVALLLTNDAAVDQRSDDGSTPLRRVETAGIVRLLVENGADVNAHDNLAGWGPLHMAAHRGDAESVAFLISKGAEVNYADKDGTTALHIAASRGVVASVKTLLGSGADVGAIGEIVGGQIGTALHAAVIKGDLEIVACLLEGGADVNAKDARGLTAVQYAAAVGNHDLAALMNMVAVLGGRLMGGSLPVAS